tara:strand:+ start:5005 stop:8310 length:3306 start_codon:yes stop_codon:yes gene_type:complete
VAKKENSIENAIAQSAALTKYSDQPVLLVNVGQDDPSRGDAAGWKGMARAISDKIGGHVIYADDKTVRAAFPDAAQNESYEYLLAQYLADYPPPQYVLGQECPQAMKLIGHDYQDVFPVTGFNESLSSGLVGERELVSHHLTQDILDQEGAIFDARHPDIKGPIMAAMLVRAESFDREDFNRKMVKVMAHYKEATIYICGSRRTGESSYENLMTSLKKAVEDAGHKDRLSVVGHKFNPDDSVYNPYKGLIARAKHFVVWGDSQSMVSEALFSGKLVCTHQAGALRKLISKGFVHEFLKLDDSKPPLYREFEPVNLTTQVAEKLMGQSDDYQTSEARKIKGKVWFYDDAWSGYLNKIRLNFHCIKDFPVELKETAEFVESVLTIRGSALKYLPHFQNARNMAGLAIAENKYAAQYIGEKLCEDQLFIEEQLNKLSEIYQWLPAKAQNNLDVAKHALMADFSHGHNIIRHIPAHVVNQLDAFFMSVPYKNRLLASLKRGAQPYGDQPVVIREDYDFAMKALDVDPYVYSAFSDEFKLDLTLIKKALHNNKDEGYSIGSSIPKAAIKKIKNTPLYRDYLLSKLKGDSLSYKKLPREYKYDPSFAMEALDDSVTIYTAFPKEVKTNLDVAKKALLRDLDCKQGVFRDLPRATLEALSPVLENFTYKNYLGLFLQHYPSDYAHLPKGLRQDRKFSLQLVAATSGVVYKYLPFKLRADPQIARVNILRSMEGDANPLKYIPKKTLSKLENTLLGKKGQEIMARGVQRCMNRGEMDFEALPDCLQRSTAFALKLLAYDEVMYAQFSTKMKNNKSAAKKALQSCLGQGTALLTKKIVKAIPKSILSKVLGDMKRSEVLEIMKSGANIYQDLPKGYRLDTESALSVIKIHPSSYKHFSEDIRKNPCVARYALEQMDEFEEGLMAAVPEATALELKDFLLSEKYRSYLLPVLYSNPDLYKELPAILKYDERFALQTLDKDTDIYKCFPDKIKSIATVAKRALIKDVKKGHGVIAELPDLLIQDKGFLKDVRATCFDVCKNQEFKNAYKRAVCPHVLPAQPTLDLDPLYLSCASIFNGGAGVGAVFDSSLDNQQKASDEVLLTAASSGLKPV